jgi:two-component system response regulator PilR (NtrC family)
VPPLRERRNDIRPLAEAILARLEKRMGISNMKLGDTAWDALETYDYPGNVRELENVLERAATLSGSGVIDAEHIRLRAVPRTGAATPAAAPRSEGTGALSEQVEHLERDAIIKALEQTRYNKTAAAKLLGVTYRALRYKIQKLEIE